MGLYKVRARAKIVVFPATYKLIIELTFFHTLCERSAEAGALPSLLDAKSSFGKGELTHREP